MHTFIVGALGAPRNHLLPLAKQDSTPEGGFLKGGLPFQTHFLLFSTLLTHMDP